MTFREAVKRLEKAGAKQIRVEFSGTDDSGGVNEIWVEPEGALERLGNEAKKVLEALENEVYRLLEEYEIGFDNSGSEGSFTLDLEDGLVSLEWTGHYRVDEYRDEWVEGRVKGKFPFQAPPARLKFRVENEEVELEGSELPEDLRESLADELLHRLREELEEIAEKELEDPAFDSPPHVASARGSLVLKEGFARYEGEVKGTARACVDWWWEPDWSNGNGWEKDLEDYLREKLMEDLARG